MPNHNPFLYQKKTGLCIHNLFFSTEKTGRDMFLASGGDALRKLPQPPRPQAARMLKQPLACPNACAFSVELPSHGSRCPMPVEESLGGALHV